MDAQTAWLTTVNAISIINPGTIVQRAKFLGYQDGVLSLDVNSYVEAALCDKVDSLRAEFVKYSGLTCRAVQLVNRDHPTNIIQMPAETAKKSKRHVEQDALKTELQDAYQTIDALRFEIRQLHDALRMQAMFEDGQAPAMVLPGQVVIDLALLREAVADLRQHHHGRNALVELLVNVDVATGKTQMSAADLSQAVGKGSRTSYERLFGNVFTHDGKSITLQFVAPHATSPQNTPENVAPHATSAEQDTTQTEANSEKMLHPMQHPLENVAPHATSPQNTPENVAPHATNDGSYDYMNDELYKESSNQEDHSFMPSQDADKKPPFEIRPVVFWIAEQTGWNWREWEKIEWSKRSRVEWIALGLHCLEHGDNPAGLFVALAKKGQPVKESFIEQAKRVKLPPVVVMKNGVVTQLEQAS